MKTKSKSVKRKLPEDGHFGEYPLCPTAQPSSNDQDTVLNCHDVMLTPTSASNSVSLLSLMHTPPSTSRVQHYSGRGQTPDVQQVNNNPCHDVMLTPTSASNNVSLISHMHTPPSTSRVQQYSGMGQTPDVQQLNNIPCGFQRRSKRRLLFHPQNQTASHAPCPTNNTNTRSKIRMTNQQALSTHAHTPFPSVPVEYVNIDRCSSVCHHCKAKFWECEKRGNSGVGQSAIYTKCCSESRVVLLGPPEYPPFIKALFNDPYFISNIRAYNQMFSMTSLRAINIRSGPYVFRISGQIYHWIGSMCPEEGRMPRFLQLYIYDTENEIANRMAHFGGEEV